MASDHPALGGFDVSRLSRQIALKKLPKTAFADEADAGAVAFAGVIETRLGGHAPDFGLLQITDGKQRPGQLRLSQRVNEIGLILVAVPALEQTKGPVAGLDAGVMAGRDEIGAEITGIVEKSLELDFLVAQDVGVRRAPCRVLGQEHLEHMIPVLGGKVHRLQRYAKPVAHTLGVREILLRGAVFRAVILVPVLHEQAGDVMALLQQTQRRHRGINPAGHADYDSGGHGLRAAGT